MALFSRPEFFNTYYCNYFNDCILDLKDAYQ